MAPEVVGLQPPGDRWIYRLGSSLFRVWANRPEASAEVYREGEWVWTSIPSGAITADEAAERLGPSELRRLGLPE